ncbi:hypothetical protein [Pararhizobium antarcticum]|uniref:Transmembrane protein n=1 Tax=Pararhizobium antarcticum TaxID=1798805 RepID=A0A657LVF7_9HYPH|nr:hypothetical protein [Pararhizobium antarcticum]OJF91964.1 hypothetical protein AX761_05610 [Rhizobium sp. 58]OJF98347.1 hypothetical protein AX760_14670 [Pararhizobium antarcticum]
MKIALAAAALAALLTACTTTELQPIPGSITYNGQPRTKLTKSPIGSSFTHLFTGDMGQQVYEIYVIQPDRSLKIVSRRSQNAFFPDP